MRRRSCQSNVMPEDSVLSALCSGATRRAGLENGAAAFCFFGLLNLPLSQAR